MGRAWRRPDLGGMSREGDQERGTPVWEKIILFSPVMTRELLKWQGTGSWGQCISYISLKVQRSHLTKSCDRKAKLIISAEKPTGSICKPMPHNIKQNRGVEFVLRYNTLPM